MKEQRVSFDTAKLAKEKGFDIKTDAAFWYKSIYNNDGDEIESLSVSNIASLLKQPTFEIGNPYVYRPTQSLLQKWLREVHHIVATVKPITHNQKFGFFVTGRYIEETRGYLIPYDFKPYDTWELALEEALKQSLQLIK